MYHKKFLQAVLLNLTAGMVVLGILGFYFHKPAAVVHAQGSAVTTQYGNITSYLAGWYSNIVMVTTNAPYLDNGCGAVNSTQYSTSDGNEGNPAFHSALLGALLSNKKVAITVQGCVYGHPQIVGVAIQP